jgi:hypothetical protein
MAAARSLRLFAWAVVIDSAVFAVFTQTASAQGYLWQGYAENSQHTTLSAVASQSLSTIRWTANEDLDPQYSDGDLLIHYGSPMITAGNLVVMPEKTTASG